MTKISVLLPVAATSDADDLRRAHKSLLDQTTSPSEILLVTNQSLPAEIEATIQELASNSLVTRHIYFPDAQGLGGVLQAGLKQCSESFIARMDADDICEPERFAEQLEVLTKSNVDIVGSHLAEFDSNPENPERTRKVPLTHEDIAEWMSWRCPMNHPTTMFDRDVVLDAGGYRDFPMMEDWDLWARSLAAGLRFRNLDQILIRAQIDGLADRRGGINYARAELRIGYQLYTLGIASKREFLKQLCFRIPPRFLPRLIRNKIYDIFAR
jgi:glycosyltransferase involved in cell wall biosynthesis